jgi:hypothetical protein
MKRRFKSTFLTVLFAALLVLVAGQAAFAGLAAVGPTDLVTNFPAWYQDSNGMQLALCIDFPAFCIPAPIEAGNPTSEQSGFGEEGFWFAADVVVNPGADPATQITGVIVLAVEAAYGGGPPAPNDQVVFTRVRIRLAVPDAGTYTVTHPYGTATFDVPAVTPGTPEINDTQDIGVFPIVGGPRDFTGPLAAAAPINPFLTWPNFGTDPTLVDIATGTRFIGNPAIDHIVVGSPTGNNFVDIAGPTARASFNTNLFAVQGQLFAPPPPRATSATFSRTPLGDGTIDVLVVGLEVPPPRVVVSGVTNAPVDLIQSVAVPTEWSVSVPITAADAVPATVTITVDPDAVAPATPTVLPPLTVTDKIVGAGDTAFPIAIFDAPSGTLTINGDSSNTRPPLPILTVTNAAGTVLGTIPHATETLTLTGVPASPGTVTITSTAAVGAIDPAGGTATVAVTTIAPPAGGGGGAGVVPVGGGGGGGGCFIDSIIGR